MPRSCLSCDRTQKLYGVLRKLECVGVPNVLLDVSLALFQVEQRGFLLRPLHSLKPDAVLVFDSCCAHVSVLLVHNMLRDAVPILVPCVERGRHAQCFLLITKVF